MKKQYVKPEMEVQEFVAEDMIMNGSIAECTPYTSTNCNGTPNSKVDITMGDDLVLDGNGCSWLQAAIDG